MLGACVNSCEAVFGYDVLGVHWHRSHETCRPSLQAKPPCCDKIMVFTQRLDNAEYLQCPCF